MRHVHALTLASSILFVALAAGCSSGAPAPSVQSIAQLDAPACGDPKTAAPDPAGPCLPGLAGDGITCQPYADLKTQATLDCLAQGGGLGDMPLADAQGCPDGQAPSAGYTCCLPASPGDPSADPGEKKDPPPPPPPSGPCTDGVVGDGVTCQDYSVFKGAVTAACDALGGGLTDMPFDGWQGCVDGEAKSARYTCCLPPQ